MEFPLEHIYFACNMELHSIPSQNTHRRSLCVEGTLIRDIHYCLSLGITTRKKTNHQYAPPVMVSRSHTKAIIHHVACMPWKITDYGPAEFSGDNREQHLYIMWPSYRNT